MLISVFNKVSFNEEKSGKHVHVPLMIDQPACMCPDKCYVIFTHAGSSYDTDLNKMFEDKAEEIMYTDLSVTSAMTKKRRGKKPDRVFGLQETNIFEEILDQTSSQSSSSPSNLRRRLKASPFRGKSRPLLYPFLIVEAKSEKSDDSFSDAEEQTAFPIKTLLELQYDLRKRVNKFTGSGPLVWFLTSRGDSWRVYGCYVNEEQPNSWVCTFCSRVTMTNG